MLRGRFKDFVSLLYLASILSAVMASLIFLRVSVGARPISSGYRLRASCW